MIIEIEKSATIFDRRADAALVVVDSSGRETNGLLRSWPDIAQVIEMKAICKDLAGSEVLHFEIDSAHIYVITDSDVVQSFMNVLKLARQHDVSSINIPDVGDLACAVLGMEDDSNIVVRLCSMN